MDSKQELVQNLLNNSETFLGSICSKLSPTASDNVSVEQAYKDFRREKVLFNGIPFVPQKDMICLDIFANTLTNFVERMLRIDPSCVTETLSKDSNRSKETSDTILKRSCRLVIMCYSLLFFEKHNLLLLFFCFKNKCWLGKFLFGSESFLSRRNIFDSKVWFA